MRFTVTGVDEQGDRHSTAQHTVGSHISQRTLAEVGYASALEAVLAVDMGVCADIAREVVVVVVASNRCSEQGHQRGNQSKVAFNTRTTRHNARLFRNTRVLRFVRTWLPSVHALSPVLTHCPHHSMGSSLSWVSPLVKITVLALVFIIALSSRLFAVIRFESIIHEFDPWYGHGR
jgi:hypothetical protein